VKGGTTRPRDEPAVSAEASTAAASVFTLGYQGRSLPEVLGIVEGTGIQQVLDVRQNVSSKKPGFSGLELARAFSAMGVAYVHLADLGCTPAARHTLWRTKETEPFFDEYRLYLTTQPKAVQDLLDRVRRTRSLLLCLERDPSRCHRAVLAERLRAEGISTLDL
jgi:uncharacterized protein (DUF488 family)